MPSRRTSARVGARPATIRLSLPIATFAVALLLAACSSPAASTNGVVSLASTAPGATAAPSASAQTPEQAMLSYAQCMRDHGIDMPDPVFNEGTNGGGTVTQQGPRVDPQSAPGFQAADEACQHFLADVKRNGNAKPMTAAEQQAFLDFAACMRDHGVDMADPTFEGGGVSIQIGGPGPKDGNAGAGGGGIKIDPQSPAFEAAQTACQHFLQDAGLGKFGTSGSGAGPATQGSGASPQASQPN